MLSKNTFKKMVSEVSLPVLCGVLIDATAQLEGREEVDEFMLEQLTFIETAITEIKRRDTAAKRKKRDQPGEENP